MEQDFTTKLLRFIAAEMYVNTSMYAARELFGQSLFALTEEQRTEVNAKLNDLVSPAFELLSEKSLTPPSGGSPSGLIH